MMWTRPEPLAGADYRREYLQGDFGGVELIGLTEANVATAAILFGPLLTEVLQKGATPAGGGLGVVHHLI